MMGGEHGDRLATLEIRSAPTQSNRNRKQRTVFDPLRNSEIAYLDATFVVDEDVPAFDVSMDYTFVVQVSQTFQGLSNDILGEGFLKGAIAP